MEYNMKEQKYKYRGIYNIDKKTRFWHTVNIVRVVKNRKRKTKRERDRVCGIFGTDRF